MGAGTPAAIGSRFIARLIDAALMFAMAIPLLIVGFILLAINDALGAIVLILSYLAIIVAAIYIFAWGQGETGQTPGKRTQGIKLVDQATGGTIGGGKGIARMILESIFNSVCYISSIWALFDSRNQTLHDKVLTSEVVEAGEKGGIMPIFPNGMPF